MVEKALFADDDDDDDIYMFKGFVANKLKK
jgi:hypothetical protein